MVFSFLRRSWAHQRSYKGKGGPIPFRNFWFWEVAMKLSYTSRLLNLCLKMFDCLCFVLSFQCLLRYSNVCRLTIFIELFLYLNCYQCHIGNSSNLKPSSRSKSVLFKSIQCIQNKPKSCRL